MRNAAAWVKDELPIVDDYWCAAICHDANSEAVMWRCAFSHCKLRPARVKNYSVYMQMLKMTAIVGAWRAKLNSEDRRLTRLRFTIGHPNFRQNLHLRQQ